MVPVGLLYATQQCDSDNAKLQNGVTTIVEQNDGFPWSLECISIVVRGVRCGHQWLQAAAMRDGHHNHANAAGYQVHMSRYTQ